jgi:hypothetical protein
VRDFSVSYGRLSYRHVKDDKWVETLLTKNKPREQGPAGAQTFQSLKLWKVLRYTTHGASCKFLIPFYPRNYMQTAPKVGEYYYGNLIAGIKGKWKDGGVVVP